MALTNYDIQLLAAWYRYYKTVNGRPVNSTPKPYLRFYSTDDCEQLLVILHDFETFAPSVMQEIFYICR